MNRLPLHRNSPPRTSEIAAQIVAPIAPTRRAQVLQFIRSRGEFGAADFETQEAPGLAASSVTPRRGELVKLGLVVDSGERRLTPGECNAAVCVAQEIAGVAL